MDKKTVLLASACTLLMMSCSNDAELINVAETTGLQTKAFVGEADFQIVDYAGDKCIQFKNDSVFNAMLWEMNDMSEEEINNIFSGAGFVSQWQLMQEADQEQELIVDNYEKDLSNLGLLIKSKNSNKNMMMFSCLNLMILQILLRIIN